MTIPESESSQSASAAANTPQQNPSRPSDLSEANSQSELGASGSDSESLHTANSASPNCDSGSERGPISGISEQSETQPAAHQEVGSRSTGATSETANTAFNASSTSNHTQPANQSPSQPSEVEPPRPTPLGTADPLKLQLPALKFRGGWGIAAAIAIMVIGLALNSRLLGFVGSALAFGVSLRILWPSIAALWSLLSDQQQRLAIAIPAATVALFGLLQTSGINRLIASWGKTIRWDVVGALGDFLGAFGQILIAVLAVYVAWRQYIISRDLTTQQNLITQQQTVDTYFQGISELVLDDEGLLEDWPQERAIAEGRTAAILSSVDAGGKAKVIRFLSRSRLLTPLRRDGRLGRPMLDGYGGYQEDRDYGVRVINLGVMLAASNLTTTDLRWTDLSEANLIRADLSGCDLVKTNLARTILVEANLTGADMMGTRLFYGDVENASPRSRTQPPDYDSGQHTGAVVENANFTDVQRLSEDQRYYCCAWGGPQARATIPGGCQDIPDKLAD